MLFQGLSILFAILVLLVIVGIYLLINRADRTLPKPTSSVPPKRHSDLTLFLDGRQFFDALEKAVKSAQHHIHISFYIFRNDELGKTVLDYLKEKAKEGIQVRLLLDALGSITFPRKLQKELTASGVEVLFSNRPKLTHFFKTFNHRNHRKITVIDGTIGFYGGYNVGNEYIGMNSNMGHWRDYHVQITGEGVHDLQNCFLQDWEETKGDQLKNRSSYFPALETGKSVVQFVPTPNCASLETLFIAHLEKAQHQVFIGTPYFNPSDRLMATLMNLLKKGVSLTILLPSKKDHPMVKPLSYHYFKPLLKNGARIFHYYIGFYHGKMFLIDDECCFIGTANFDKRSLFINDELNSFIYDKKIIHQIYVKTQKDLLSSIEVTLKDVQNRSWLEKSKTALSHPFEPLI